MPNVWPHIKAHKVQLLAELTDNGASLAPCHMVSLLSEKWLRRISLAHQNASRPRCPESAAAEALFYECLCELIARSAPALAASPGFRGLLKSECGPANWFCAVNRGYDGFRMANPQLRQIAADALLMLYPDMPGQFPSSYPSHLAAWTSCACAPYGCPELETRLAGASVDELSESAMSLLTNPNPLRIPEASLPIRRLCEIGVEKLWEQSRREGFFKRCVKTFGIPADTGALSAFMRAFAPVARAFAKHNPAEFQKNLADWISESMIRRSNNNSGARFSSFRPGEITEDDLKCYASVWAWLSLWEAEFPEYDALSSLARRVLCENDQKRFPADRENVPGGGATYQRIRSLAEGMILSACSASPDAPASTSKSL